MRAQREREREREREIEIHALLNNFLFVPILVSLFNTAYQCTSLSLLSEHFDVNNVTSLIIFKNFPSDLMPFFLFGTNI